MCRSALSLRPFRQFSRLHSRTSAMYVKNIALVGKFKSSTPPTRKKCVAIFSC